MAAFHGVAIALLALLCAAIYSNTLSGPFVYDDGPNIEHNEWIRVADLHPLTLWRAGMESRCTRPIAYMSFALNYYFGELEVRGYHLVNAVVHAISGMLVYLLAIDLFRRSRRPRQSTRRAPEITALLAAAIFIAHPIQTQSVTYIVQRMSSMATMFCLLAFVLFLFGRDRVGARRVLLWLASGGAWWLALATKQTAMPLPLLFFVYEWFFRQELSGEWLRKHWGLLIGALALMASVSIYFLTSDHEISYDLRHFSLVERLLTQPRVVLRYLGLLLFPHPSQLNLLHDVPISHSLLDPPTTLLAPLVLLGMGALAIRFAGRFRVLSFCVVWFFVSLGVESSFISLELMFEHRLYLPMVGFSIGAAWLIAHALQNRPRWLAALSLCLVALLSLGAYQRNEVWQSKLALWQDAAAKSPNDYRALNNLGDELRAAGKWVAAKQVLLRAVEINPDYYRGWWNLAAVASDRGDSEDVIRKLRRAVAVEPVSERANPYIATAHGRLAMIFVERDEWGEAQKHAEAAVRLDSERPALLMRLAWILAKAGEATDLPRAIQFAERADQLTGHSAPRALDALAMVYATAGRFSDAARVVADLLELDLAHGGGREVAIRRRLASYRAAAEGS